MPPALRSGAAPNEAPRIYNLFPLLAGPLAGWRAHLPRIQAMGFNWIYLNPLWLPGNSGSLYAIRDFDRLHPVVQGEGSSLAAAPLARFVEAARASGQRVMLDLVLNHAAQDSLLAEEHADWFVHEDDGTLRAPRAIDPVDPRKATIWRDLAEIAWEAPAAREGLLAYFNARIKGWLEAGVGGFRCDAAYQVPAAVWRSIMAAARTIRPDCVFAAETLRCTPQQVEALGAAGFDYLFNSSKWWDFRAPWLLEQYERYRRIAPSISFPESHDTPRLAADAAAKGATALEAIYRLRATFAAGFSSGWMIPMGFEYGFSRALNVVSTRPADWDREVASKPFDLTEFIGELNRARAQSRVLNIEGPQQRVTSPTSRAIGLMRLDSEDARTAQNASLLVLNPSDAQSSVDPAVAVQAGAARFVSFRDLVPARPTAQFAVDAPLVLSAFEARMLQSPATQLPTMQPSLEDSRSRLEALAPQRVVIEEVFPELDSGRFAVKRVVGDRFEVWADIFGDGHDLVGAHILWRRPREAGWNTAPLTKIDNDRWSGRFPLAVPGRHTYTIEAWRDLFASRCADMLKKRDAGQDSSAEFAEARDLLAHAQNAASGSDKAALGTLLARLQAAKAEGERVSVMNAPETRSLMARLAPKVSLTRYPRTLEVYADRPQARFSAWYELFPRSQSGDVHRHGTLDDVIGRLPYVRDLGFDVLYFPPIHPIGSTARKGRNNSLIAEAGDPGSPYAIGSAAGGHDALHPELGTFDDFRRLNEAAHQHGLEIALDFAVQCSRDHPWLREHKDWFDWRADGTIRFAENPPKKYEDIVNVDFDKGFPDAWLALRDVVLFWVAHGVKIFRVDNPHTKPLPFWEWMIRDVQDRDPEVLFLSEAFTRPKMMRRLAKLGFSQSYTYFTWRTTKREITEYMQELVHGAGREYFRSNFFVNTPDINPPVLHGGRPAAFKMRAALAALLSSSWGMYSGFELNEGTPIPGKEEYLNSEKYELKAWDWDRPGNIRAFLGKLNRIRRENPALWQNLNLRFYNAWNDNILYFGKVTENRDNFILVAVNLDPHNAHGADFEVPLWEFSLPDDAAIEAEELLTGARFRWHGKIQRLWLDPNVEPVAIWRLDSPHRTH